MRLPISVKLAPRSDTRKAEVAATDWKLIAMVMR